MSTPKNIESTLHEQELTQLRRQASEKENQVSRVQGELWKKNNELQQLRDISNETMAKLRAESSRVMELESNLGRLNEDLRSERFTRENVESILKSVKEKLNSEEQAKRHLELELEDYTSRASSQHQQELKRLRLEKQNLESRLRTAEARLQEERLSNSSKSNSSSEPTRTDVESQRYIEELQDKLSTAHKDLSETSRLLSIARKEADKTSRLQNELITAHNARMQAENLLKSERSELDSIRGTLEDQEEELKYWRSTFGDKAEEEDRMVDVLQECDDMKQKLAESKARELALSRRLETVEARQTDLVIEKEEALNELDRLKELYQDTPASHSADADLRQALEEKDTALRKSREYANELQQIYKETLAACDAAEARVEELEKQIQSSKPDPLPLIVVSPPPSKTVPRKPFLAQPTHEMTPQDEAAILRLLQAVDRLRSERDSLRRAVHFTSVEHRISLETAQGQLSEKSKEIVQLQAELETLRQHLDDATTETTSELLKLKDETDVWRTRCETLESERQDAFRVNETDLQIMQTHLEEVEASYRRSSRALEKSTRSGLAAFVVVQHLSSQVDALPDVLKENEEQRLRITQERDVLRVANETLCSEVATLEAQIVDVKREKDTQDDRISSLHSEIQDLHIQISNLQYEVKEGKEELLSARSGGSVSEDTEDERDPAVLLSRITTLEQRVARRTEQIGTLQHDSKRLETNLRLAEETVMELTGELEDIKREQACLVDDCAQARKERDVAQHRVEEMEVEVETLLNVQRNQSILEESLEQAQTEIANHTRTIESLVGVIFDSKVKLRRLGSSHVDVSSRLRDLKEQSAALEGQYAHSLAENERLALRTESMEVTLVQQTDEIDQWKQGSNSAQAEISTLLNSLEELKNQKHDYETRLSQESNDHLVALESLRTELAEAREKLISSQKELEKARKDEENSRQLLESLQADDNNRSAEVTRLNSVIRELQTRIEEQTTAYQSELASLRQEFDSERLRLQGELEDSSETGSALREEYGAKVQELEEKLAAMESLEQAAEVSRQQCEAEILALQARIQEETTTKLELKAELQETSDNVAELENHISDAVSRYESQIRDLKAIVSEGQSQIDEQTSIVNTLQREKNAWDLEQIRLEAELERASTKYQHAEQQLRNSERELHTLENDIQHLRAQATRFEEAAQDAETALVSQTNQFEQKLAAMQHELEKRVNNHQFEEAMGEFQEKIEYLEAVLQMKSAEIEENEDRLIEVLKDNKRLQSKVESLDRKYRGSQTKYASLTAKNEELSHENGELRAKLDELNRVAGNYKKKSDGPIVTPKTGLETDPQPRTVLNLPRPKTPSPISTTPSFRPPTRIPSSPAAVLRAKTPDPDRSRKTAASVPSVPELPVIPPFLAQQARTKSVISSSQTVPDLQSAAMKTPPSVAQLGSDGHSSSGRKRRLPDDFDSPSRMAVQAVFAPTLSEQSTPSRQHRRLLGKESKGFVPTSRLDAFQLPSSPAPLPRRVALAEATNSPKDAVRSLGLGKPSITTNKTVSAGAPKTTSSKSWLSKSRMVLSKDGRSVTNGTERRS